MRLQFDRRVVPRDSIVFDARKSHDDQIAVASQRNFSTRHISEKLGEL